MLPFFNKIVTHLKAELDKNKGIVPDSWNPFLDLIKAMLKAAETFEDATLKADSEIIIAAINAFETAKA